jgi:hypothetical protein
MLSSSNPRHEQALKKVDEIDRMIDNLKIPGIPICDILRDAFGGPEQVADVTGRTAFVVRDGSRWAVARYREHRCALAPTRNKLCAPQVIWR